MLEWITQNLGTIIITVILACVVAAIVFCRIRNRKKGVSSCGCGCENCAASEMCKHK